MISRIISIMAFLVSAGVVEAADAPIPNKVSYYRDVRPIFQQHCQGCHQPARHQGQYQLTDHASLLKAGESEKQPITPGQRDTSFLLEEIRVDHGKAPMPKGRPPLDQKQYDLIAKWITQGAADDTPPAAKADVIDADHPPVYRALPVITSLAISPDGKLIAATGYHEVLLHKADGSGLVGRLVGLSERVQSLAFSPDGTRLAVAGGSPGRFGEIQVWGVENEKLLVSAPLTFDTVYGLSWSPDGKLLAVGCADNTVRAIDSFTGKQALQMGVHSEWALGTVFSQDGLHLVSVSRDMSVKLTEVATQRFMDNVTSITPGALKGGLMAIDRRPMADKKMQKMPADANGAKPQVYDELLVAGADGIPRLYKMHREVKREIGDDANKIKLFEAMPGRVSSIKFAMDGKYFAAVSSLDGKGAVRVYDTEKGAPVNADGVTGPAYAVAWMPDGATIASGGFDGVVWLHDAKTGKLLKSFAVVPEMTR